MGERFKESTQGVDNSYKYLINKDIYYGFTKFPDRSAICLVQPSKVTLLSLLTHVKLSPASNFTIKS